MHHFSFKRTSQLSVFAVLLLFSGGNCDAEPTPATTTKPASSANWYPSSIALPNGLTYHCALTPLPPSLDGIPAQDRVYINHTYAMILKSAQAKTIMCSKLTKGQARNGYSPYYAATLSAIKTIRAEPTPKGLESFRNDVLKGLGLQMSFFDKASTAIDAGRDWNSVMQIPEGRQASSALLNAWSQMKARYTSLGAATENSMYHHLCALDLF